MAKKESSDIMSPVNHSVAGKPPANFKGGPGIYDGKRTAEIMKDPSLARTKSPNAAPEKIFDESSGIPGPGNYGGEKKSTPSAGD